MTARSQANSFAWAGEFCGHAAEGEPGELEFADGFAELQAVDHVFGGLLDGRLGEAAAASARLQPSGGEAGHLQIEAAAFAALATDQVLAGYEVVVELQGERVHAAVAGCGVGLARHLAAAR